MIRRPPIATRTDTLFTYTPLFRSGCDDFADQSRLVRTLSRGRAKDMASDYMRDFADRRAIMLREPSTRQRDIFAGLKLGPVRTSQTGRGMFDGLRLSVAPRSEEHTSELQSLMRTSYAVFCLNKKKDNK